MSQQAKPGRQRLLHLVIQPVLVEDDGESLSPGMVIDPLILPLSEVPTFIEGLPAQIAALNPGAECSAP